MNKQKIKDQIEAILTGIDPVKELLIVDTHNCDPGFYRLNGKIINKVKFEEITQTAKKVIILTHGKNL